MITCKTKDTSSGQHSNKKIYTNSDGIMKKALKYRNYRNTKFRKMLNLIKVSSYFAVSGILPLEAILSSPFTCV